VEGGEKKKGQKWWAGVARSERGIWYVRRLERTQQLMRGKYRERKNRKIASPRTDTKSAGSRRADIGMGGEADTILGGGNVGSFPAKSTILMSTRPVTT